MRNWPGTSGSWLFILPLLAACASMDAADETLRLQDTSWTLAQLAGQPARAGASLSFADDRAHGSDGCNRFSGSYTVDGTNLAFGNLASTQMACAEPVMQQAQVFTAALGAARSAQVVDGQLSLLDASGRTLATLAPDGPSPANRR